MSIRIVMLSPIAWRTPPRHYGPWESVLSLLTEQLLKMGLEVTLFATGDSQTSGHRVSLQLAHTRSTHASSPRL